MTWQPIETAPHDVDVLVRFEHQPSAVSDTEMGLAVALFEPRFGRWLVHVGCGDREVLIARVTHWQPLPSTEVP